MENLKTAFKANKQSFINSNYSRIVGTGANIQFGLFRVLYSCVSLKNSPIKFTNKNRV